LKIMELSISFLKICDVII